MLRAEYHGASGLYRKRNEEKETVHYWYIRCPFGLLPISSAEKKAPIDFHLEINHVGVLVK